MPGELKPELSDVFQAPSHPGTLWTAPPPAAGVQECPEPNVVMLMQQGWQEFGDGEGGEGKGRETGKPSLLGFGMGTNDARGGVEGHRM